MTKQQEALTGVVRVRGARQNNLRNVDLDIPRDAFVVFTGVSGSGKSSLAFGTIFAEAQRRYFESVAPYARRLMVQLPVPKVREITGLPPAVALQQRRAEPTARSSVGTLTTLSNSMRMLFSRCGTYPSGFVGRLDSDAFSPNTVSGACPTCHGIGILHTVSEKSLVPDPNLSIRDKAIAAWPGAWQGKNYRDILAVLGYDVDKPWKELSEKDRQWILFTEEKPVVTVHAEREAHRIQRPYQGTYMSAASYVRHTFSTTNSATLRKRVARFMESSRCPDCDGKRLKAEALAVKFAGCDIAEMMRMPVRQVAERLAPHVTHGGEDNIALDDETPSAQAAHLIAGDIVSRISLISEMGLDYLSLDRATPTLSAGELQRLRLISQLKSGLFGVVYILDEPSAGLHPADSEALFRMLVRLKELGNSLFVVEHDMNVVRSADWIVDMGPGAGDNGGTLLFSGPLSDFSASKNSLTREYLLGERNRETRSPRKPDARMRLHGVSRHNLKDLNVEFPLGLLTVVSGISGSGKSTLVSQVLSETVQSFIGSAKVEEEPEGDESDEEEEGEIDEKLIPAQLEGAESIRRFISVDQKPIGRTPRSNLATYTGVFDHIRKKFAATDMAKEKKYTASRFSFNVDGGRCDKCAGEGYLSVELMFLPSVYSPCPVCHGSRYNSDTLQILYKGRNIAEVLDMTVDAAAEFFADVPGIARAFRTLQDVGLGYIHLGQPATELSGGEAQRIKLATELQRAQTGSTLYILDEPTTGLHPADTDKLMRLLHALVDGGNTVIVVEHDLDVLRSADWIIDLGPGAGENGGKVVASGPPVKVAKSSGSKTGQYLARGKA